MFTTSLRDDTAFVAKVSAVHLQAAKLISTALYSTKYVHQLLQRDRQCTIRKKVQTRALPRMSRLLHYLTQFLDRWLAWMLEGVQNIDSYRGLLNLYILSYFNCRMKLDSCSNASIKRKESSAGS